MASNYETKNGLTFISDQDIALSNVKVLKADGTVYGIIKFVKDGKAKFILGKKGSYIKYVDGFIFEPMCPHAVFTNDYKHIARYMYQMNEKLKTLKKEGKVK